MNNIRTWLFSDFAGSLISPWPLYPYAFPDKSLKVHARKIVCNFYFSAVCSQWHVQLQHASALVHKLNNMRTYIRIWTLPHCVQSSDWRRLRMAGIVFAQNSKTRGSLLKVVVARVFRLQSSQFCVKVCFLSGLFIIKTSKTKKFDSFWRFLRWGTSNCWRFDLFDQPKFSMQNCCSYNEQK